MILKKDVKIAKKLLSEQVCSTCTHQYMSYTATEHKTTLKVVCHRTVYKKPFPKIKTCKHWKLMRYFKAFKAEVIKMREIVIMCNKRNQEG